MTRINANISSLVAQTVLQRSNNQLQETLTRLSTGLRINTGRDDPSGLIASEKLRSDIVSVEAAIINSERANQVIATADSSLGQVSSLLNDIRGLVTESANTGALSEDQIAANQLQVDSSLEALNRISQTTSFQGRRLLDGSLDFIVTESGGFTSVTALQIDQANLGTLGSVAVTVNISAAATQATITDTSGFSAAANANAQLTFSGELDYTTFASSAEIFFQSTTPGTQTPAVTVDFVTQGGLGAGNEVASFNSTTNVLTVTVDAADPTTAEAIAAAINTDVTEIRAVAVAGAVTAVEADAITGTLVNDFLTITAAQAGPDFNNTAIVVNTSAAAGASVVYSEANNTITITVNDTTDTTLAAIVAAFAGVAEFGAVASATGDSTVNVAGGGTVGDITATANTANTGGGVLSDTLVFELSGASGAEVLRFGSGTSVNLVRDAINLVSDATGVSASVTNTTTLNLLSSAYGTAAFVNVDIISEGSSGTFTAGLSAMRVEGTDIVATVNGTTANGDGNTMSINTAALDVTASVTPGSSTSFSFTITGGGAVFQLGPDVVSNQQARLGIQSVNTASLGSVNGLLFQLGSGGTAALATDPNLAALILAEAIDQVTGLRGRLGAFQKTTIDTNIQALNDTLVNLTDAESQIRDADFADETANLTRAQILVQAGTSVLAIANSNPQNVLALLR